MLTPPAHPSTVLYCWCWCQSWLYAYFSHPRWHWGTLGQGVSVHTAATFLTPLCVWRPCLQLEGADATQHVDNTFYTAPQDTNTADLDVE